MSKASVSIVFGTGALATLVCQRIEWKLVQTEYLMFFFVYVVFILFITYKISSRSDVFLRDEQTPPRSKVSYMWWLLPFLLVFGLMLSWKPSTLPKLATSTEKVQPGCTSSVTRHTPKKSIITSVPRPVMSTTKPTAKLAVDEAEAASRHQAMLNQLQAIAAEGARKGEGCIAFTKRLASTSGGKYFGLVGLDLKQCVHLAQRYGVPALHYRHPDGSTTVLAPELAVGKTSGWHIGVDTTPVFVVTRQWSIKGMP